MNCKECYVQLVVACFCILNLDIYLIVSEFMLRAVAPSPVYTLELSGELLKKYSNALGITNTEAI